MRPRFDAQLVNEPFGDPGVYVDFRFEKRALLFDLGDNTVLAPKKLLRLSHVFVSHTHMDHFIGFDRLLRICVGRQTGIHLFGPPGFIAQVGHKLAAYTWNLVHNYETDFILTVTEIGDGETDGRRQAHHARFRSRLRFEREDLPGTTLDGGVLLQEEGFRVRAALLDHRTPCLGFALEESMHVNVWKNRLLAMGLQTGPWLRQMKRVLLAGRPDNEPVRAWWKERGAVRERIVTLGELKAQALELVPGQKICYVTDVVFHDDNRQRIAELARHADLLFIESVFLDADSAHAQKKKHLTAREAGTIARLAGARLVVPFHFSPRYAGRESQLHAELAAAFGGQSTAHAACGAPAVRD
ncbi:MAG: ribonuclease Z [Burkholderiales bacterium]